MRAVEDHHVDRPGVDAQQCVELTGPNRSIGLRLALGRGPEPRPAAQGRNTRREDSTRPSRHRPTGRAWPAWWFRRGANTRSHPELGRENPQRRWYCVSRRGRVGRRQAGQAHPKLPRHQTTTPNAGWSSPVARQAHNLKVAGSNPAPATRIEALSQWLSAILPFGARVARDRMTCSAGRARAPGRNRPARPTPSIA